MAKSVKKSAIEINILAHNTLADVFPAAYEAEKSRLGAFAGKAIFKVDKTFMERYKGDTPSVRGELPDGTRYTAQFSTVWRGDRIYFACKLCLVGGSYDDNSYFCIYVNHAADLYKYEGTVGAPLTDPMPDHYDLQTVVDASKKVIEAEDAYTKALAQVPYMFRENLHLKRLTHA